MVEDHRINDHNDISDERDSMADVIAAVVLVVVFVTTCIFWVSAQ